MKFLFLIPILILTSACTNGSYIYSRVGIGVITTDTEWKGVDHASAHLGAGYMYKHDENNLVDFNWTHNSQYELGEPWHPEKEESWLNYFGVDYIRIFD